MLNLPSWHWHSKCYQNDSVSYSFRVLEKEGLIVQNHPFQNDSFSLSSLDPPIKMSHLLEISCLFIPLQYDSSWKWLIFHPSSFIPHPSWVWINAFVIVLNLRNALYILSKKCWIPKIKNFWILKQKYSNTIKMFSNDDYEFEDLANQMSQTQINESGNIGGLSML